MVLLQPRKPAAYAHRAAPVLLAPPRNPSKPRVVTAGSPELPPWALVKEATPSR